MAFGVGLAELPLSDLNKEQPDTPKAHNKIKLSHLVWFMPKNMSQQLRLLSSLESGEDAALCDRRG